MKRVFADTYYFLAFLNKRDRSHRAAHQVQESEAVQLVTTAWVLTEVLDAFAEVPLRKEAGRFVQRMSNDPQVTIVPPTIGLFESGLQLYLQRPDKSWSLTDCISFEVMRSMGLTEALTADRDFEQAGFVRLLP